VQVDPIKSKLKAPRSQRLKLKYCHLLSSLAFKFILRRYNQAVDDNAALAPYGAEKQKAEVGWCRLTHPR